MEVQIDPLFRLTVFSHFFKITHLQPRVVTIVLRFCQRYVQMGMVKEHGKMHYRPVKVWAARVKDNTEFRFHIGQLKDFLELMKLNHITPELFAYYEMPMYPARSVKIPVKDGWSPRDYQEQGINFILQEDPNDNRSRLVCLGTGLGKTFLSLCAQSRLGTRCLIIVLATYMDKWAGDIANTLKVKPNEIMLVKGTKAVQNLISHAQDGELQSKFIIVSLETIRNFYKSYEASPHSEETQAYGCHPEDFAQVLQAGTLLIDETHQHLNTVFKILLYTHVPKLVALSATLISDDPFIDKMQKLMFPKDIRFLNIQLKKYIKSFAIAYSFEDFKHASIRTTEYGNNVYSHTAFEKSILRKSVILNGYIDLIDNILKLGYFDDYIQGDKAAIFCASVDMAGKITQYLQKKYPKFDVRRYCENDPYENIIDPDIRVTTIISGGTAIDIPNLRTLILTNNIKSPVANLQTMGRLRDLQNRDVKFYYLYCEQIAKHKEYHETKKELIRDRVLSYKEYRIAKMIPTQVHQKFYRP